MAPDRGTASQHSNPTNLYPGRWGFNWAPLPFRGVTAGISNCGKLASKRGYLFKQVRSLNHSPSCDFSATAFLQQITHYEQTDREGWGALLSKKAPLGSSRRFAFQGSSLASTFRLIHK